jgi:hypothetical protein
LRTENGTAKNYFESLELLRVKVGVCVDAEKELFAWSKKSGFFFARL